MVIVPRCSPQAHVLKSLYVNLVLWWKTSAKQMIPINQQQYNTNALIRGISYWIKWICAIVFLDFLQQKIVQQEGQHKQ